jgi:hypothetical protein
MTLAEIAFGCYIYTAFGDYDESYFRFFDETRPQLDLSKDQHCKSLLVWLNKWGCLQFKISDHDLAASEIKAWYEEFGPQLFQSATSLLSLSDSDFATIEAAYDGLVDRIASMRAKRKGDKPTIAVTFGPVGTAKILFAVRPNALMPWDNPIFDEFKLDGSASAYVSYLRMATRWLNELSQDCQSKGINLADLPSVVGRPRSPLPKLIDEYLWVAITKRCKSPSKESLEKWVTWA